ncbi:glycosyltransferase [Gloeothece verrucosa]|uniref:Glycosyl transferase family 2 n=1 Tax=Gloeothece verrucosa (strain PCC 7822) TaxID=497965 RepID=E0UC16_GLOV7|nr:glycosyltransferase [Gloeothece verrucosa]ADN16354.1 glycosyl transferase family 2 [Gloeothece verrucosa PCC 7822]
MFKNKIFKFLIGGGFAAAFNIVLMFLLIEWLGFNTVFLRNIANVISIELSLLLSFFIYRIWVWPGGVWTVREVLWRQIPLYHVAAGTAIMVRIFLLFPLLDWLGINYAVNTLVGVLVSASLNYLISDRLVFKTPIKTAQKPHEPMEFSQAIYYPEGLAPALEEKTIIPTDSTQETSKKIKLFSLVIPAYNEESCIQATVESISQLLEQRQIDYEILVVNDNSRDRTEEVLKQLCDENPRVNYINNYYPNGYGFAVRCGLENFRGDAVAIVMADSSDSPENIVDYYYKLQEGYDCVFGSRFIRGGKVIDYPVHKLIVNRLANAFIKVLFGLKLNDTTNAFKIYRREVIEGISPLISHHFNLTVEMPLKAIIRGYSYSIIPITWQNRKRGVSKLKLKEMGSRYLFIVLFIWLEKYLSRGDYVLSHLKSSNSYLK